MAQHEAVRIGVARYVGGVGAAFSACGAQVRAVQTIADLGRVEALTLNGGGDIHPRHYGEAVRGARPGDGTADETELALIRAALVLGLPVFGVCRGLQLINVALGGSLYQDLHQDAALLADEYGAHLPWAPAALGHRGLHDIAVVPGTPLHAAYRGARAVEVNSIHHQAIRRLGRGLRITALAADGVIEGIAEEEGAATPIVGVQFHPEMLFRRDPQQRALLDHFLATVAGRRASHALPARASARASA